MRKINLFPEEWLKVLDSLSKPLDREPNFSFLKQVSLAEEAQIRISAAGKIEVRFSMSALWFAVLEMEAFLFSMAIKDFVGNCLRMHLVDPTPLFLQGRRWFEFAQEMLQSDPSLLMMHQKRVTVALFLSKRLNSDIAHLAASYNLPKNSFLELFLTNLALSFVFPTDEASWERFLNVFKCLWYLQTHAKRKWPRWNVAYTSFEKVLIEKLKNLSNEKNGQEKKN